MATDVRFMLEVHVPGAPVRPMVIPPVSRYVPAYQPARVSEWTLGDRPIKQKSGFREFPISLAGTSGGAKRFPVYNRDGVATELDGRAHMVEFVEFIKRYEAEGKLYEGAVNRDPSKAPRLVFRSMQDEATDEAWYVEITSFVPVRDTEGARTIRSFTLELLTEGLVSDAKPEPVSGPAKQQAANDALDGAVRNIIPLEEIDYYDDDGTLNLAELDERDPERAERARVFYGKEALSRFDKEIKAATVTPTDAVTMASLAEIRDELPARWAQMRGPLDDFTRVCRSAKEVAGVVRSYVRFPAVVTNSIVDAAVDAVEVLEAFADAVPLGEGRDEARKWFMEAYGSIENARSKALAALGQAGGRYVPRDNQAVGGTPSDNTYGVADGRPVVSVPLEQGETLPAFAGRVLGDPSRWEELLALNGMASPFDAPDGGPLTAGLILRAPSPQGVQAGQEPELFGSDLAIDDEDNLILDGTTDFARVRGEDNLTQALRRRLLAVKGSNIVFPLWGLLRLIGEGAAAGTVGLIGYETRAQMKRDNRVRAVADMRVSQTGGRFEAEFSVRTATGSTIPVVTPFPT